MITETRSCFGTFDTRVLAVEGDGAPIVLLHGYADSADTWRAVLMRFHAVGRRALAVDLPGFGQAQPRSAGALLPQFDGFADAVLAAFGPAVLVGNSLGAATAVRAASRNGESVRALVAIDDPLGARHLLARAARARAVRAEFWSRMGRFPVPARAVQWTVQRGMPKLLYGVGVRPDPQVVGYWTRTVSSMAQGATLGRYAFEYAYETRAGHHGIRVGCPTLIVHGARDRIIPVHSSRALHQQIPGSDFVVLPKSGHCPQLDNPSEVVRLVLRLLERAGDHVEEAG